MGSVQNKKEKTLATKMQKPVLVEFCFGEFSWKNPEKPWKNHGKTWEKPTFSLHELVGLASWVREFCLQASSLIHVFYESKDERKVRFPRAELWEIEETEMLKIAGFGKCQLNKCHGFFATYMEIYKA